MTFIGCQKKTESEFAGSAAAARSLIQTSDVALIHETKFGGIYTRISLDEFHAYGFEYGDSIDVVFDNGYQLTDIPYYNGYFVKTGMPMVAGYPGEPFIYFGFNDGEDVWIVSGADEDTKARFVLHEKGKYKTVQETFSLSYSDERSDYDSDEAFANFRALTGGNLKPSVFFRSASPCDDQHRRASVVDKLVQKNDIQFVIDLADSQTEVETFLASAPSRFPYFSRLLMDNRVALLDLSSNFRKNKFKTRLAEAFVSMLNFDGPYLIHCLEGKDRTGFAAVLLEGLCGASYTEMQADYMKTYDIYYHINTKNRAESYNAVSSLLFDAMVGYLAGTEDIAVLKSADYTGFSADYLREGGMTDAQIGALKNRICMK